MTLSRADRDDLIRRYEEGPAKLAAAWAKVPPEARMWRPAEKKWSAHEVVVHCADSETNAAARIRYLVAEAEPKILGYDQAHWADALEYHALPAEPALETVKAVRANTAPLLRRLGESAWAKVGTHSESGTFGAERWLQVYAEHLEKHTGQIERVLEAWKARARG